MSKQRTKPVAWQFYQNDKWSNGSNDIKDHRKNTEAAGIPTRDLYTHQLTVATREDIRRVLMKHGFTIKDGHEDLKPYVYEAAEALLRELAPLASIPDGYKIAPIKPTHTMGLKGNALLPASINCDLVWTAMLNVVPKLENI